jgi:predicted nuclease of predicted toxin-antitoxin system
VKLLLDENLSPRLVASLSDLYPGLEHVHECNLGRADDKAVWEYAKEHGFVIVSKDSDFFERSVLYSNPPKIIWVRIGNCSTDEIEKLLRFASESIRNFVENDQETCLLLNRK